MRAETPSEARLVAADLRSTLVPLLVTVGVIGALVAGIAVPNLIHARERRRQQRTMGDLRTIATAMESYSMDHGTYAPTPGMVPAATLAPLLEPTYVTHLPRLDGWGTPLVITSSAREYTAWSFGADHRPDVSGEHLVPGGWGGTTSFDADIIFSTGSFVQFPHTNGC